MESWQVAQGEESHDQKKGVPSVFLSFTLIGTKGKKVFEGSRCPDLINKLMMESRDHFTLDSNLQFKWQYSNVFIKHLQSDLHKYLVFCHDSWLPLCLHHPGAIELS